MPAVGLAALRLTLAAILVSHGAHQLFGAFAGPGVGPGGLSASAARLAWLGLEPAMPLAVLRGVIEFVGGALVGAGLLTRWAALAVAGELALTNWKDQSRWGFFLNWTLDPTRGHGAEFSVLLIGALVSLVFAGGGDLSLDGFRARSAASRAASRARIRSRS
jgi:putative oxidoreductase